jgi:hypothetical protein
VEETGVAIKRVLAMTQSNASHSHRPQSALRVVAAYIETYNSFLYACINHAVTVCAQQLQQCAAANDRAAHDLDAPRVAYVAVAVSFCSLPCSPAGPWMCLPGALASARVGAPR